jgi:hypothetical protein
VGRRSFFFRRSSIAAEPPERTPIDVPTGPGAAAILAAGIGSFALGVVTFAGDAVPDMNRMLVFWQPAGALSGVTSTAIAVWLVSWYGLSRRWGSREVNLVPVNVATAVMVIAALLLTFPPFMDLLQGK